VTGKPSYALCAQECSEANKGTVRHRTDPGALARYLPTMNITLSLGPIISLIAGILILVVPRLLNYIVAVYLIVIGLIGLFGAGSFHLK
jgi:hypothetical protein